MRLSSGCQTSDTCQRGGACGLLSPQHPRCSGQARQTGRGKAGKAGRTGQEWGSGFLPTSESRGASPDTWAEQRGGEEGGRDGADELGGRYQIPSLPHDAAKPHFSSGEAAIVITWTVITLL